MKNKILVIEDDPRLRENIFEILEAEGYEVEFAENGLIGIGKVGEFLPDLIISDIMMPEVNGFEVLEKLLDSPETASIPFIFLSAKVEVDSLRRGMNLGADDYIFKPFHIEDLLNAVKRRLSKKEVYNSKIKEMQEQIALKIPHELRTPLVPILGYSEMIGDETDIDVIKAMAKVINKYGKDLHGKIEKFLIYKDLIIRNKFGKKSIGDSCTKINDDVIGTIITELNPASKPEERINYNIQSDVIPIKEEDLKIIIREIIENSLKFSDSQSPILVEGKIMNNSYKITIVDFGRGMTEREIQSITAFKKNGKEQLTEHGVGLGLTIVKLLADIYDSQIVINSELNKSTKIEVIIPLLK